MKKKYWVILCMYTAICFTTGCADRIKTPSDTIKSPQYSKEDKIFNDYKEHLRENRSPEDLLNFLKKHISELSEKNADIAVTRVIELQESLLPKYEEKFLEYSRWLSKLGEEYELHDLSKPIQKWADEAKKNGYKLTTTNIKIDYESISKIAADHLSDELKDYIKIESDDYGNSHYNYSEKEYLDELSKYNLDNHLDELAKRINQTYLYIEKHENSPHILRVKELRKMYLEVYLYGSPNNPSFEHYRGYKLADNVLKREWRKKYTSLKEDSKNWQDTFGTSEKVELSKRFFLAINNYKTKLEKNDYMLNEATNDEINEIITNLY